MFLDYQRCNVIAAYIDAFGKLAGVFGKNSRDVTNSWIPRDKIIDLIPYVTGWIDPIWKEEVLSWGNNPKKEDLVKHFDQFWNAVNRRVISANISAYPIYDDSCNVVKISVSPVSRIDTFELIINAYN